MRIKVLIVEDEAIIAMTYSQGFDRERFVVTGIASTGEEAIAMARESRPDIVLMDIKLQGEMDGIAAAKVIRERLGTQVIFVTGNIDKRTRERASVFRPFAFLEKPVEVEEISKVIRTALPDMPMA